MKLLQVTQNRDGFDSYYLEVGDYKIHIWDENLVFYKDGKPSSKQSVHRWSCTCIKGSLISPKYGTLCKHIRAAEYYLINKENGNKQFN